MNRLRELFDDYWFEAAIIVCGAAFFWALIELISIVVCPT